MEQSTHIISRPVFKLMGLLESHHATYGLLLQEHAWGDVLGTWAASNSDNSDRECILTSD